MDDYSVIAKYKGLVNDELLIRSYFSGDANYIICGSENQNVYIWNTLNTVQPSLGAKLLKQKKNKKHDSYEYFKANSNIVTSAQFFPRNTIGMSASDADNILHMILTSGYNGELKIFENRVITKCQIINLTFLSLNQIVKKRK